MSKKCSSVDATSAAVVASSKQQVRQHVWSLMESKGIGAFPFPLRNRIPNFIGSQKAAEQLRHHPCYLRAATLKCCPDSPQLPLRHAALCDGKTVYMAVPRLRDAACFVKLDPAAIDPACYREAASIRGMQRHGVPVSPLEMPPIDLVVAGSVAVRQRDGARLGKGAGYSDLEFGIAVELGIIRPPPTYGGAEDKPQTMIVTTVHDEQVMACQCSGGCCFACWQPTKHDIPLDFIFTPSRALECAAPQRHARPNGIYWDLVTKEMRQEIPVLDELEAILKAAKTDETTANAAQAVVLQKRKNKNRVQHH